MCEVISLKVIVYVKREFRCANLKYALFGALGAFLLGLFSFLLGGRPKLYSMLLLPRFAPPALVFVIVWIIVFALLGASFGIAISPCRHGGKRAKLQSILWFSLLMLAIVSWYPVFFSARLFLFSLILCGAILFLSLMTLRSYASGSYLSAIMMVPVVLWFVFAFVLNFCVVLLN